MLSTLLMLAWILAICWLRSDVQTPNSNPVPVVPVVPVAPVPVQDTTPKPEIKHQEPAVREFYPVETFELFSESDLTPIDVEEEVTPRVTAVEEAISSPIYEKDWKSGCCLITNKNGKKLTGVTLERRIAKLKKLDVLI